MKIARSALEAAFKHARKDYPYEACGMIIGPRTTKEAILTLRGQNTNRERPWDRFNLADADHIRAQRIADDNDWEILVYYHSHPDHPAKPSKWDAEPAWAGQRIMIIAVEKGVVVDSRGFVAEQDHGPFTEEPIEEL